MVEIGNIVTLENGMDFTIIEETYYDSKRYVFTVLTDKDDKMSNQYMIFEVITQGNEEYLNAVTDNALYGELHNKFIEITRNRLESEKE